jgi:hypothetical protein
MEQGEPMAFKPNYRQQRTERTRAKEQKKNEKLQRREEAVAKRKTARAEQQSSGGGDETPEFKADPGSER